MVIETIGVNFDLCGKENVETAGVSTYKNYED